jgi:hypothetical protein
MPITEDGRCVDAARCLYLPDHQRLAVPVDELALTARLAYPSADPFAGALDIVSVCGVGADRLDAKELTELGKPLHRRP